jgi:hypothetical protein
MLACARRKHHAPPPLMTVRSGRSRRRRPLSSRVPVANRCDMTAIIFDLGNRVCDNCSSSPRELPPTSADRCSFAACKPCKLRAADVRQ